MDKAKTSKKPRKSVKKFLKVHGVGRRTLYDLMDPKKEFNPSLATLAAVIRSLAA